ncbi:organic hydroperoxide resistance protein [Chitinophaga barathri]|uniref:Organic hydroperoxide resistance protein n=1 Tax=Chitinophaga barathri TaxID=1647451 RepID=A0A3N4MF39_9BACT|nr:organic hydroperoxide resistance protein [Chitinophaga barathri]RPD38259.1 organic hydroperoxide resistance protein [Chitinophaga barathri]
MVKVLYTATATATGGRDGQVTSDDGILNVKTATPKELGGPGGEFTNPEQLFAAGYSACFDSALNLVIRKSKAETGITAVTAQVGLGSNGAGGYGLAVTLDVLIPGIDQAAAEELVAKAHQVCPYSNAVRNNVEVTINTRVA